MQAFGDWLAGYDPDVLIGWNGKVNSISGTCSGWPTSWGVAWCWGATGVRCTGANWTRDDERRIAQCPGRGNPRRYRVAAGGLLPLRVFSLENVAGTAGEEQAALREAGRPGRSANCFATRR